MTVDESSVDEASTQLAEEHRSKKKLLSFVGPDDIGLVAKISERCSEKNYDILNLSMEVDPASQTGSLMF